MTKKKPKKGKKPVRYAFLACLGLAVAACGMKGPGTGSAGPTTPLCACGVLPTGAWACTAPLLEGPQGALAMADLLAAWAPVIAAASGKPELGNFAKMIKVVSCA